MVAVISVDADTFLSFLYLSCHLEGTGIGFFWLHCVAGLSLKKTLHMWLPPAKTRFYCYGVQF